jgi:hypothetical protein
MAIHQIARMPIDCDRVLDSRITTLDDPWSRLRRAIPLEIPALLDELWRPEGRTGGLAGRREGGECHIPRPFS